MTIDAQLDVRPAAAPTAPVNSLLISPILPTLLKLALPTAIAMVDSPMIPMTGELKLVRDANGARTVCTLGNFTTPAANGNVPPNGNQVGLRAVSMNSDFDWFMWIDSPP